MMSYRIVKMKQWARRMVSSAFLLVLTGLVAPPPTLAVINDDIFGEEIIEIVDTAPTPAPTPLPQAPWVPGGYTGGGTSSSGQAGDSGSPGGGGSELEDADPLSQAPPLTDPDQGLGTGPDFDTLKDIGFRCKGPLAPAGLYECSSCADTASGRVCVCHTCEARSNKCTSFYDCTATYGH